MKKRYIAGIILIIFVVYCIQQNISHKNGYKLFVENRQKWSLLKIEQYQYSIKNYGDCFTYYYDTISIVENGNYLKTDEQLNYRMADEYLTINNIFDEIEKKYTWCEKDLFKGITYKINIQYDETYHFPKNVKYSWILIPFVTDIGTHYGYEINNFIVK